MLAMNARGERCVLYLSSKLLLSFFLLLYAQYLIFNNNSNQIQVAIDKYR